MTDLRGPFRTVSTGGAPAANRRAFLYYMRWPPGAPTCGVALRWGTV